MSLAMVGMGNRKSSQQNSRPVLGLTEISTTSWIINLFMLISLCFLSRPSIPASFVGARAQRCIVEVPCAGKATRHFNVKTALSCPSLLLPFPSHPRPPGAEISSPKTATTPRKPSPQYPTPLLPAHHNPSLKKPKPSPSTHPPRCHPAPSRYRQTVPPRETTQPNPSYPGLHPQRSLPRTPPRPLRRAIHRRHRQRLNPRQLQHRARLGLHRHLQPRPRPQEYPRHRPAGCGNN